MLNLDALQSLVRAGENFEFLFFWGHRPSPDGTVESSCLSQFYAAPFVVDGVSYPTAEHYMMAGKARLFGDGDALNAILDAPTPKEAKKLGRKVAGFDEGMWADNRVRIVLEANRAKFSQNVPLRKFLLGTGKKILVEASPFDRIWGIGLGTNSKTIGDPLAWKGQNLLGFALMDVRDWLETQ